MAELTREYFDEQLKNLATKKDVTNAVEELGHAPAQAKRK